MSQNETIIVHEEEAGSRLDSFLKVKMPELSRSYFQELIEKGLVLVNQEVVKKRTLLEAEDEVEIAFPLNEDSSLLPQKMDLDILYEDDYLIAINKPAGLVVHPACGHPSSTLVNGLLYHIRELRTQEGLRPGIVHRLDKDTTGVIVCAKTREIHEKMVELFATRTIEKSYLAITLGIPKVTVISNFLGRDPYHRQKMAVVEQGGKEAHTFIEVLAHNEELAFVRLFPKTGRTHQLRVHLHSLHCPILGDSLYGNEKRNKHYSIASQLLHAHTLKFIHPVTREMVLFTAPLPENMKNFLKKFSQKLFL